MACASAAAAAASDGSPSADTARPRVALALSGGSARGLAHIGVLQALEEAGIRVDAVAATSMGAVIGALYASGYSADDVARVARSIEWQGLFSGRPDRTLVPISDRVDEVRPIVRVTVAGGGIRLPGATESDHRVNRFLTRMLARPGLASGGDFDRLPVPFRAVAMDLHTGERVVLSKGSLPRAVRASMSFPVRWPPVPWGDWLLVDGGLVDNLPVSVARDLGADVVIAVDTTEPLLPPERYTDALGVAAQVADLLRRERNQDFAAVADVTLRPAVEDFAGNQYEAVDRLIALGREAVQRRLGDLRAAVSASGGAPVPAAASNGAASPAGAGPGAPSRTVAEVRVVGHHAVRERFVRRVFELEAGAPFDLEEALHGIDALHATRLFDSAWLELFPAGEGEVGVVVNVREHPPFTVEPGGGFNEADQAIGHLGLRHRNLLGGGESFRLIGVASDTDLELRATLSAERLFGSRVGAFLRASTSEERPRFFRDDRFVARAEFDRRELEAGLQHAVGHWGLLRGSVTAGRTEVEPRDRLDLETGADRVRLLTGLVVVDSLDDAWFPEGGAQLSAAFSRSFRGLGASRSYWGAQARGRVAVAVGGGVTEARLLAGASGGEVPVYELFRVGGPHLVPGLEREERWGRQALAASLSQAVPLRGRLRLTLRAGLGGAWERREEVGFDTLHAGAGAFLEHPTPVGPLFMGVGRSGSEWTFYATVGYPAVESRRWR